MSFVVYKSSAGSGKTFALVKEYLKLVLNDDQVPPQKYKHILAITFTNKAASEMKERIIKALKELSENNRGVLMDILKEETALDENVISKRAAVALSNILHNYSDFAIGTIDSFVHKIVRSFAFDLNISMDFEIEMDGEKLLSKAIDELINKIGTDEQLTKVLIGFAESKADEEKSWHIENDLQKFASALLNENGIAHIEKLKELNLDDFFKIKDTLNKEISTFEGAIKKIAGEAFQLIQNNNILIISFYQGDKGIGTYFRNLSEGRFDKIKPNSYVYAAVNEGKWTSSKASQEDISAIEAVKNKLVDCFNNIQNIADRDLKNYVLFKLIRATIYSLAVLNEIEKIIVEIKKENNILHISEFNKIISKIVFDQPAPFIYERIGEKYQNYLVDEFQDTSVLQWQNILPLIDNSLAYDNFNMIVGDGKQAIYRWRGGEVDQFARLPEIKNEGNSQLILEREQTLKNHFQEKKLNKNYRSRPGIIDFNNKFFTFASSQLSDDDKRIYREFQQEAKENNEEGYVSIEFLKEETGDNLNESACKKAVEIIRQNIIDGRRLNEIAILTRNNREGNTITSYLIQKGINVVSSESLLLKNSPTVNFLTAVLDYIQNTGNVIAKASVIEYLVANKRINSESFHEAIENALLSIPGQSFSSFLAKQGFDIKIFALLKMSLYDLCEELIRVFILNKNNDPYLLFFLDEVFSYSSKRNNNITDFMEWWETQKEKSSIVISEGSNAVNVMTIHKSKGLEFPVVIIPYANWASSQNNEKIWIDIDNKVISQLKSSLINMTVDMEQTAYADEYAKEKSKQSLDNLNLLYVAMTRPIDELYIIATKPKGTKNTSKLFIDFLKETASWDENKFQYEYGIKPSNTKNRIVKYNVQELKKTYSSDWRAKVAIRTSKSGFGKEAKKDYGIIVHDLLSRIKTEEDIETIINRAFYEGSINDKEKTVLTSKIKRVVAHPLLKVYFQKNVAVKLESDILLPSGETYRPDRVIIEQKKATIIDYKTGKELDEHTKQLNQYESVLKKMGFEEINKLLVYFEEEKVQKV